MTDEDIREEYRRQMLEHKEILAKVDAVPSDRIVSISLTKGDIALLIRSQTQLYRSLDALSRRAAKGDLYEPMTRLRWDTDRAKRDLDVVVSSVLRQIAASSDG